MAIARPAEPYPDPSWSGWGDPEQVPVLPEAVQKLLIQGLGVRADGSPQQSLTDIALPDVRLTEDTLDALAAVVGRPQVSTDPEARVRHTRGKSTPDLLRLRAGDAGAAPDAVLTPASHEEILEVLTICSERRVAVVPFGGGTSVVGGLAPEGDPFAGVIALDVRRMDAVLELDEVSRVAVLEAGLRAPQAEELLGRLGYTLGHFPQSFEYASVGGFAATRSSGQASAAYGRFDEMVVSLRVATPAGTLALGRAPKSAAGPDLRQLVLGSEGAFGVITSVGVAVRPRPEVRRYEGWRLESFPAGLDVLRRLAQDGPRPSVLRLSDEAETALNLGAPGQLGSGGQGALAIVGYEGAAAEVEERHDAVARVLEATGAELDSRAGEAWARERYRGPYLRDALLDAGALAETLETATFWSALPTLYETVAQAIRASLADQGTPAVVLCHVSHIYPTGASLYFTVGCAQARDPVAQWAAVKAAASDAIIDCGGSITHHHGVGVDHRPWYVREVGPLGVGVLRAVKAELDPAGIMNPGVLLPRE